MHIEQNPQYLSFQSEIFISISPLKTEIHFFSQNKRSFFFNDSIFKCGVFEYVAVEIISIVIISACICTRLNFCWILLRKNSISLSGKSFRFAFVFWNSNKMTNHQGRSITFSQKISKTVAEKIICGSSYAIALSAFQHLPTHSIAGGNADGINMRVELSLNIVRWQFFSQQAI